MSVQIVLDVTNEFNSGSESGFPGLIKLDTGGHLLMHNWFRE